MNEIPIIITKNKGNNKIVIRSSNSVKKKNMINTCQRQSSGKLSNIDCSSDKFSKNKIKVSHFINNNEFNDSSYAKKSKKFKTLDHRKQTDDIRDKNINQFRGKTQNNENNFQQNQFIQKQNKVRIRRIQSSGTRRQLPKDFFSQQHCKNRFSTKNNTIQRQTIEHRHSRQKSRQKNTPINWQTLQPKTQLDNQHEKLNNYLIRNQSGFGSSAQSSIQTPKFTQKCKKSINNKTQSKQTNKDSLLNRCSLGSNKIANFTVNKKKYVHKVCRQSDRTQKQQKVNKESEQSDRNSEYKKIEFLGTTFSVVPLEQICYNATFGQNQWNKNQNIININQRQTQSPQKQKQNTHPHKFKKTKKGGVTNFRESYLQKINGLKDKNSYFVTKQILQQ